ncbi:phospholipase D-like domain-containing protein [Methanogenium marinum]|uniref:Phospholipase D-like domain-containing protein n=1 Tax=Methanogenium marinum TaxID=348610 RepID=A0A9Q4PV34_9EURY|nr:helicase-related protein [Methanogenium marinum]MDE4907179.1 phospholipase D-like domain-containing protein [Methanogenium marinum]
MFSDLTFITNENDQSLYNRFNTLINNSTFFDCLVGYFYTSGFYKVYKSLENTEKIRILIGISTNSHTYKLIEESQRQIFHIPDGELKEKFSERIVEEFDESPDNQNVETGTKKFIEWIRSGKLEVRAYPSEKIHAKLYIMTFKEGAVDKGRVITGSSNFTEAGLEKNLEFNVELKDSRDHKYALSMFNRLWEDSVDVSEKYVETINSKTWLNDEIKPYELYLKFLYEYFKERLSLDGMELEEGYTPDNFMDLKYQKDAVQDSKQILEEYGGVFIADVVGLGKTYTATLLARELDGRTLVVAPPGLIERNNPGSWNNAFGEFGVRQGDFESIGKLDSILSNGIDRYKNVIIDESHAFRNEETQRYEKLAQICKGKRVILVSATPLNNTPKDILAQIKLFQDGHKSTLPNPAVRDLDAYFGTLQRRLDKVDRKKNSTEYIKIIQENSEDIRKNVLDYLMVRRTRTVIEKYYKNDLKVQGLKFPKIGDPSPIYYAFDDDVENAFDDSLKIITESLNYTRYTPLLYLKKIDQRERMGQINMGRFMKVLLLKRLESSQYAFTMSLGRFIKSYERFIEEYEKGYVYVSRDYSQKIFELLEKGNFEIIDRFIEEDRAKKYAADEFDDSLIVDLKSDLSVLKEIKELWDQITIDPKLERFKQLLNSDKNLKRSKILVFTESKETAKYLESKLKEESFSKDGIRYFSGSGGTTTRNEIINNFDASVRNQKDDFRILVTTDVLSEGMNLNRSNVVINYDIPWNPVRMMQRVGRINRVANDLPFNTIYTYNFFPTGNIEEEIGLESAAEAKIEAFIEMLGDDAPLLLDEEVKSHESLFRKLNSKKTIVGEEEDDKELEYLQEIRRIRDEENELFVKIKRLPKKARSCKKTEEHSVITFFRRSDLRKFYLNKEGLSEEVDFVEVAGRLRSPKNTKRYPLSESFFKRLDENKRAFESVFEIDFIPSGRPGGNTAEAKLERRLRAMNKGPLVEEDEEYLQQVYELIERGAIPKNTMKRIWQKIQNEDNSNRIIGALKMNLSDAIFKETYSADKISKRGKKEVILSMELINNG